MGSVCQVSNDTISGGSLCQRVSISWCSNMAQAYEIQFFVSFSWALDATHCRMPQDIPIQSLKPRTPEQFSGRKHRVMSSTAAELSSSQDFISCPSETHTLGSYLTTNMKHILQQEILRHVLPKPDIQCSSLKQPLSLLFFFSLSCLKQNIQPKESCILLRLFHTMFSRPS